MDTWLCLVSCLAPFCDSKYEVWVTPTGQPTRLYSATPTREAADKVAAAFKAIGTAEVRGPILVGFKPGVPAKPTPKEYTYFQKSGRFMLGDTLLETGYSGFGEGKNNPAKQGVMDVGPIPVGLYTIGPDETWNEMAHSPRLTPNGHNALGRTGFRIHADYVDPAKRGTASTGCIILSLATRKQIAGGGIKTLRVVGETAAEVSDADLTVPRGQLTFDAEGDDDPKSRYYSRKAHCPLDGSGLTIGRGYDTKFHSEEKVKADLLSASAGLSKENGLSKEDAELFAKARTATAGKSKKEIDEYIRNNKLPEISRALQKKLFEITYAEMEADVKRICEKDDVVEKYGATDWAKLHPAIRDILVDLRYRGDYHPTSRAKIQKLVAKNDLAGLAKVMADASNWPGVPADRFKRRVEFITKAVAKPVLP